jgi:hypothetical protein
VARASSVFVFVIPIVETYLTALQRVGSPGRCMPVSNGVVFPSNGMPGDFPKDHRVCLILAGRANACWQSAALGGLQRSHRQHIRLGERQALCPTGRCHRLRRSGRLSKRSRAPKSQIGGLKSTIRIISIHRSATQILNDQSYSAKAKEWQIQFAAT